MKIKRFMFLVILVTVLAVFPNVFPVAAATYSAGSVYSAGSLSIDQSFPVDLDAGAMTSNFTDADVWYEAVSPAQRYVTPVNGATIAKSGTSFIGASGCAALALSTTKIDVNDLPAGTFVCVLTSSGRYSEFVVTETVGVSPSPLKIAFRTWAATYSAGSVYSAGSLSIDQSFPVDLDAGAMTSNYTDADFWYEAVSATQRYVTPINGATIAKSGTPVIGAKGCAALALSTTKIDVNDLPAGTFVCVLTSSGRYSEFAVTETVGVSPSPLKIAFRTWEAIYSEFVVTSTVGVSPSPLKIAFTTWEAIYSAGSVYSAGSLSIDQSFPVDLDAGAMTSNFTDADFWYEAATATHRYVTPINGATMRKIGTSSIGANGCAALALSTNKINVKALPAGTYVCVLTSSGRYSEFVVTETVGVSPSPLKITFTTWEADP